VRVLVTGGTGFIGCHTVAALARRGHAVRLLVRDPERIGRALDPLSVEHVEHVVGDVTDADAVERAVSGCDAVIHAAALFTLDRRRDDEVMRINAGGAELVFDAALRASLDPIVHVSSVSALFPPAGNTLGPDEEVKDPQDCYARSKATAERVARRHQAAGAPVVTVYPGSVWGPCAPTVAEGIAVIIQYVKRGFIPVTPGGIPIVDVRDVAAVHAAAMEPGRGPRRFMLSGNFLNNAELTDTLNAVTGRKLRKLFVPGGLIRGIGRLGDLARRGLGVDIGLTYEAMLTLTRGVPGDDSRAADQLGIRCRPAAETLGDTLRWMYERGVVERRHVGMLAP
jgi:nucleoside-diphosphate-sugar epimerase